MSTLILLLACWMTSHVLANKVAGPAQALFLYQAYCIEFLVVGDASKGQIAPGCAIERGMITKCNLNQFLRYIENDKADPKTRWTGDIKSGNTIDGFADPETNMGELYSKEYRGNYLMTKLLPGPTQSKGLKQSFVDMYKGISDEVAALKSNFGAAPFGDKITRLADQASLIQSARRVDNSYKMLEALKKDFKSFGAEADVIPRTNPGESYFAGKYNEVDTDATRQAVGGKLKLTDRITYFYNNGQPQVMDKGTKAELQRHVASMQVCGAISTNLRQC